MACACLRDSLPQLEAFQKARAARASSPSPAASTTAQQAASVVQPQPAGSSSSSKPQVPYTLATGPIQFSSTQTVPRPAKQKSRLPSTSTERALQSLATSHPAVSTNPHVSLSNGYAAAPPANPALKGPAQLGSSTFGAAQPEQVSGGPRSSQLPAPLHPYSPAQALQSPHVESAAPQPPQASAAHSHQLCINTTTRDQVPL